MPILPAFGLGTGIRRTAGRPRRDERRAVSGSREAIAEGRAGAQALRADQGHPVHQGARPHQGGRQRVFRDPGGQDARAGRRIGLRQDHDLAHDPQSGDADRGPHPARRPADRGLAGRGAARLSRPRRCSRRCWSPGRGRRWGRSSFRARCHRPSIRPRPAASIRVALMSCRTVRRSSRCCARSRRATRWPAICSNRRARRCRSRRMVPCRA
jgi:hypothetical protein